MVARELARLHGDKIVSTSVNPGNINTDLQRHMPRFQAAIAVCVSVSFLRWPALTRRNSVGYYTQLRMER